MKNIFFVFVLITGFALAPLAQAQDDDMTKRLEAAAAYERTTPTDQMMDSMFIEMKKSPQLNLTDEDIEIAKASINQEELRTFVIQAMAKNFTEAELKSLTAFYGSIEGQSILKKFPVYLADIMPYVQQVSVNAAMTALQKKQAEAMSSSIKGTAGKQ
jgi:hypothetical protein